MEAPKCKWVIRKASCGHCVGGGVRWEVHIPKGSREEQITYLFNNFEAARRRFAAGGNDW